MNDVKFAALRRLPELLAYTDSELAGLVPYVDEVAVATGQRLATAGRPASECLVVLEGEIDALGRDGARRLGPGAGAGWCAMWAAADQPETLVAATSARLLVMGRAQFRALRALGRRQVAEPAVRGREEAA